jgi:hypothetical protein
MSGSMDRSMTELSNQVQEVQQAATKLIARLAERAAYASDDEYRDIRTLMTALRGLSIAAEVQPTAR